MPKLCLNMIVRNEAERIERCLNSVAPYIDSYVIFDTGSTDGTIEKIEEIMSEHEIPGEIHTGDFKNFEQARNAALRLARNAVHPSEYILLCDADMELFVEDPAFKDNLQYDAYDILQKAAGISYYNRRIIKKDTTGWYRGVTHEYLDVAHNGGRAISGVYFIDHADGANRKDKFERDIKLLLGALRDDPDNGRSWFYLAQSYRDAGQWSHAAQAYKKRVDLGGWEEETYDAQCNYAHMLKNLGNTDGFVFNLQKAYNMRPQRAEPLYDLSKYYREKGEDNTALIFARAGLGMPRPDDQLFVGDFVYNWGLKEEFAISAFYNPAHRHAGYEMCSRLAIKGDMPSMNREGAKSNLYHYIKPLGDFCPSFEARELVVPNLYEATQLNPSICQHKGALVTTVRTVNYTIDDAGRYLIKDTNGEANSTNPINTVNYIVDLTLDLTVANSRRIIPPPLPKPEFDLVIGFEDMRLFSWNGDLWTSSTMRELNAQGCAQQVLTQLLDGDVLGKPHVMSQPPVHEKNWMPRVSDVGLEFFYRLNRVVDPSGVTTWEYEYPELSLDALSGGSQVIPFFSNWLAVIHEARALPVSGKRYYQHRFVMFDTSSRLVAVSMPFCFHDKVIEFAAGLAWHPDGRRLIISYGREDNSAWLATINAEEVSWMLSHGY